MEFLLYLNPIITHTGMFKHFLSFINRTRLSLFCLMPVVTGEEQNPSLSFRSTEFSGYVNIRVKSVPGDRMTASDLRIYCWLIRIRPALNNRQLSFHLVLRCCAFVLEAFDINPCSIWLSATKRVRFAVQIREPGYWKTYIPVNKFQHIIRRHCH